MKVMLAQINTTVGALEHNADAIMAAAERGARQGADLVVLPELCSSGYVFNTREEARMLAEEIPDGSSCRAWADAAARHGVLLMVERNAGLIVEVTDGDTFGYRGNLFYDLAKNAVIRLAYAMAADLHAHAVTALAVTPGFLRSEAVLDHFGVTESNWHEAIEKDEYFAESETPCFVGRAIAALAADPDVAKKSGGLYSSWELAKEYGLTDVDGRRPDWGSFFLGKVREILERDAPPDEMDVFVVRSRLYQAELDPSATREAERLRAWLGRHE